MKNTMKCSAIAVMVLVLLQSVVSYGFGQMRSAVATDQFDQAALHGEAARSEALASGNSHWLTGAVIGAVVGGVTTAVILNSGGSTALCNRSENQDAMSSGECLALTAGGALVGAALGAFIGSRIHSDAQAGNRQLRVAPLPDGRVLLRTRISL